MRVSRRWPTLLAGVLAAACGDGAGPADDGIPSELIGTWIAGPACYPGCAVTLFDRSSPADSVNFAVLVSWHLRIEASGDVEMGAAGPGDSALLEGRLEVLPGRLVVIGEAGTDTLDYTVEDDVLRAQLRTPLSFDLDGDGSLEAVGLRATMIRP